MNPIHHSRFQLPAAKLGGRDSLPLTSPSQDSTRPCVVSARKSKTTVVVRRDEEEAAKIKTCSWALAVTPSLQLTKQQK